MHVNWGHRVDPHPIWLGSFWRLAQRHAQPTSWGHQEVVPASHGGRPNPVVMWSFNLGLQRRSFNLGLQRKRLLQILPSPRMVITVVHKTATPGLWGPQVSLAGEQTAQGTDCHWLQQMRLEIWTSQTVGGAEPPKTVGTGSENMMSEVASLLRTRLKPSRHCGFSVSVDPGSSQLKHPLFPQEPQTEGSSASPVMQWYKDYTYDAGDVGLILGVGKFPQRSAWQPTPVFLPGESHGQKGLACCDSWGCRVRHDWATELNWNYYTVQEFSTQTIFPATRGLWQTTQALTPPLEIYRYRSHYSDGERAHSSGVLFMDI